MAPELTQLLDAAHESIEARNPARLVELIDGLHYADLASLYEDLDPKIENFSFKPSARSVSPMRLPRSPTPLSKKPSTISSRRIKEKSSSPFPTMTESTFFKMLATRSVTNTLTS